MIIELLSWPRYRETIEKQAEQLSTLESKFEELEDELKANRGDIDSNTAAVEKLEQVSQGYWLQHSSCREAGAGQTGILTPTQQL